MFLVYEIKFTVGKSKVTVFTAGKRRGHWGFCTLGGGLPQEMSR